MRSLEIIKNLQCDTSFIQDKKEQTTYKIAYIKEYISYWIEVSIHRPNIKYINFIDCMCNAGIYADGDLATSMEVLKIFREKAYQNPDKEFNVYLNDISLERIEIITKISQKIISSPVTNIKIHINSMDVNVYLQKNTIFYTTCKFGATVLFVDPYDFGTVHISSIQRFIKNFYCEVIFNVFTSDYVRNGIDHRIRECIGDAKNINNKEDLIDYIISQLQIENIKYHFSYRFHTATNTELYQIMFFTPHSRGIEKLKEALWKTFNGRFYHRNGKESYKDKGQVCFFDDNDDKNMLLNIHASQAQELLFKYFEGQILDYVTIKNFLLQKTMLQESHCIHYVLTPLIEANKIRKMNLKDRRNFKSDSFIIGI